MQVIYKYEKKKVKNKAIQLMKITHKIINDEAKENCNTTLEIELNISTLKEAFGVQKKEHESEIQKQKTEMNRRRQEEIKQEFIQTR